MSELRARLAEIRKAKVDALLAGLHQGIGNEPAAVRYEAFALNMRHIPTPVEAHAIAVTRLTIRAQKANLQTAAPAPAAEPAAVFDPSLVKPEPEPEGNFDGPFDPAAVKQEPGLAPEPRRSSRLGSKLARASGKVATAFDMAEFERKYLEDLPVIDVDAIIREEMAGDAPDDEDDADEVQLFDDEPEVEYVETRQVPMRAVKAEPKRPELGDDEFEAIIAQEEQAEEVKEKDKGEAEPEEGDDVNQGLEGESADEQENDADRAFIADDEPEAYVEGVDIEEPEEELEDSEDAPKKKFVIESSESDTEGKGSKPHRKR